MIHGYQVCRSLGYIVERRVGKGLLIITAMRMDEEAPETMYMLSQMAQYAASGRWETTVQITEEALGNVMEGTSME